MKIFSKIIKKRKKKRSISKYFKWLPKKNLVLSLTSSALFFLTLPPFNLYFLGFIAFIPFFLIQEEEIKLYKFFRYGCVMGFALGFVSFFWLIETIQVFGNLPLFVSVLIFLLFCAFFSLKYGIFIWLANALQQYYRISTFLSYGGALILVELFFPELFPAHLGNTQAYHFYFIQVVDVIGVHGMSFIVISLNYFLYELFLNKNKKMLALIISLFFVIYSYGVIRVMQIQKFQKNSHSLKVGVIQPDTPFLWGISLKDLNSITQTVINLTQEAQNKMPQLDLIIWPESATPFDITYPNPFSKPIVDFMQQQKTPFIFNESNFLAYKAGKPLHTMASYMDAQGKIKDHYHKIYLLPFGEYLPLSGIFPSLHKIFPQVGIFKAGNKIKNFNFQDKFLISPLICYEIIHADLVRKFIKNDGDLIVNLTNDKWFGESNASFLHLWLLYPRAIENRVPLIRATNSGSSAVIDQAGHFIAGPTPIFTKTSLAVKVPVVKKVFGLYTYLGEIPLYFILIYVLWLILRNRKSKFFSFL